MGGVAKNICKGNDEQIPLVSICSITFNHAPYIRQCLDGFLMQKTTFRYEIIIHDDASTDGTADIIKEYARKYPDLITPIFQLENQYSKGLRSFYVKYVFPKANGKYIALCEGDDYWTDPFKLQKQVDFLESHPDYVMCSHCHNVFLQKNNVLQKFCEEDDSNYSLDDLINGKWPAQMLTVLFRREALSHIPLHIHGDVALFYFLLKQGIGIRLKDNMATYRIHETGIWGGLNNVNRICSSIDVRLLIYNYDKSKDAARYLFSMFKTPIPLNWYKVEFKQFTQVLTILLKRLNLFLVIKIVVINFISSIKRHYLS